MTRVLVAEEDADVRFQIEEFTRGTRFDCLLASSFNEAVNFSSQPGEKIEILLTSLMLVPYHAGSLANRLKAEHPRLKVLFMSGLDLRALNGSLFLVPGMQLLSKPFTKSRLLYALELLRLKGKPWADLVAELEKA